MFDAPVLNQFVSPIRLSDEQLAIANFVDTGKSNILVIARAGTGKTFLIRQCIPLMRGRVAIAAYNTKIAKEIAARVVQDGNKADVATFHSFGFRALRRAFPNAKIEGKGTNNAGFFKFDVICDKLEIQNHLQAFVKKAMSLAMQSGFGVLRPLNDPKAWLDLVHHHGLDSEFSEDNIGLRMHGKDKLIQVGCQLAAKAVKLGIQMAHEVISFDDMIYLPLVLNLTLDTFQWVCVDEAQDSNALRREMANRMVLKGGRMFFVGDDRQAIYGFTGADNDALQQIGVDFACTTFPMTVTRRCSKAVVALAQRLVPDYRAYAGNASGSVLEIDEAAFEGFNLIAGEDAIICRNTAPLVKTAYKLIARGVPAHVEGKEIGKGLLALVDRWTSIKTISALTDRLNAYLEKEVAKLIADKKEMAAEALTDKVETIFTIMTTLPKDATVATLRQDIISLFADTPDGHRPSTVVLMTAHRSKGLEFRRVFGWGTAKFSPSKFAKQDWQLIQELNLCYVQYTRAIDTYVEVSVE